MEFKFRMGDRVKIKSIKGKNSKYELGVGLVGFISAVYDPALTPNNYPKCEYRISIRDGKSAQNNENTFYVLETDIEIVKVVVAYCYKKGSKYEWFSSLGKRPGAKRCPELDHTFVL